MTRSGRLILPSSVMAQLWHETALAGPFECCGLLIGRRGGTGFEVARIAPAPNLAPDPRTRFDLDIGVRLIWEKRLRGGRHAVIGHYHSHPTGNAAPSATDTRQAGDEPGQVWLILACDRGGALAMTAQIMTGTGWHALAVAAAAD